MAPPLCQKSVSRLHACASPRRLISLALYEALLSFTGVDFERTSVTPEREILTRVPWAISTSRSSPSTALVT